MRGNGRKGGSAFRVWSILGRAFTTADVSRTSPRVWIAATRAGSRGDDVVGARRSSSGSGEPRASTAYAPIIFRSVACSAATA